MRGNLSLRAVFTFAVCAVACARSHEHREIERSSRPVTVLEGFQDQVVLRGLVQPTAMRFARDGRVFIAEKSGFLKVFDPRFDEVPRVFADLRTQVHNYWDRGLVDVELHPDFPETPYLYVLYTLDAELGGEAPRWGTVSGTSDRCPTPPGPTAEGCVVSGRVSRLEVDGDGSMRGLEEVLIENWPNQFPGHSVAALIFGPDGMLYVSGGDGASFDFVDYGQVGNALGDPPVPAGVAQTPPDALGGALRAQNTALAPVRFNGKIIRVDPETGLAAPGNPLEGSSVPDADSVIASGFRNPWRMTFRPGTGELWVGDVGWGLWEEIDRLVDPLGETVENFGWPCFESVGRQASYEAANLSACADLYASGEHVQPYYAYSHLEPVVAGDGCGDDGQAAITGLAFYGDGLYPAEYRGALFFADYSRNCIWVMLPGETGLPDPNRRRVFVSAAPQPLQLTIGPGSDLYYLSHGGELHRVAALGENKPPVAQLMASPSEGAVPLAVTFDGSGSSDPDPGDNLMFAWDLDGDGAYDDEQSPTASYVYSSADDRNVSLRVTDSRGAIATASVMISAGEPGGGLAANIHSVEPLVFRVGESVQFSGSASDAGQPLSAATLRWDLVVQHCPSEDACHPHLVESFDGESGSFVAPEHDYPYHLELILRVGAADGREATAVERIDPLTAIVTLETDPPGLPLALNDTVSAAPFTAPVVAGARNTIAAPEHPGYRFVGWSNGDERAQLLTVSADTRLTAHYAIDASAAPLEHLGSILARVPVGMGSDGRTLEVIRDDDMPPPGTADSLRQYDTFTLEVAPKDDWIGYEFPGLFVFSRIVFQEGLNFGDGGWFEQFEVRVRRDGVWSPVSNTSVTPTYPGTTDHVGFRTYRIDFDAVAGDAIQLYGPAGGAGHFISIAELDVYGWRAAQSDAVSPIANVAGPVPSLLSGEAGVLDARSSFDPAGEPLTYQWLQTGGPAATVLDPSSPLLLFVAPEVTSVTELEFTLTVAAGTRTSAAEVASLEISPDLVDVSARGRIVISEPTPQGGGTRDVEIIRDGVQPAPGSADSSSQFDTFTGDATVTEGWVGYEFDWAQPIAQVSFQEGAEFLDGGWFSSLTVEVRRDGQWVPAPNLVALPVYPGASDGIGFQTYTLSFTPVLADGIRIFGAPGGAGLFFSVAELRVFARPLPSGGSPPVASAGVDFVAPSGGATSLDGSTSFDPDAAPLSYAWTQVRGPEVELSDPASVTPTFTAPSVRRTTTLHFSLVVSDATASSYRDEVAVTVRRATSDLTAAAAIIASTRVSQSGQSGGLQAIRDGVEPPLTATDPLLEFDTWTGKLKAHEWIGYQFPTGHTFTQLVFQEGLHFSDGGWFTSLAVQVRRGGVWRDVQGLASSPAYPGVEDGQGFQTYTLTFEPTAGDAIRIFGFPGGSWTFFTVAELRVLGY